MDRFVDLSELPVILAFAVQAVIMLMFIVSPLAGALLARGIGKRGTTFLILATALFVYNLMFVGLTALLQDRISTDTLNDDQTALLSLIMTTIFIVPITGYILWLYKGGRTALEEERRHINNQHNSVNVFEERRRERLKNRKSKR